MSDLPGYSASFMPVAFSAISSNYLVSFIRLERVTHLFEGKATAIIELVESQGVKKKDGSRISLRLPIEELYDHIRSNFFEAF